MSTDYMQITILGCGSSTGVPRVGNDWGLCDPEVAENMRSRCSILLERVQKDKKTSIVIDTGPDFRMQMNRANVKKIDAVFYTHEHADHTHGIDDLRMYALRDKKRINVYTSQNTSKNLMDKFGYCFTNNSNGAYPPYIKLKYSRTWY
jgi:phosphoribosyl 1,2-cyclic phosphate phosphodiesterase